MDFTVLAKHWPSAIVSRDQIAKFTGGLISPRSMANMDSLGQGPPRGRCGRKVFYPVDELVKWLAARAKTVKIGA